MKEQNLNSKVQKSLLEFESIENIDISEDWNNNLMNKISTSKSKSSITNSKITFVVLLIILLNIGFILNTLFSSSEKSTHRTKVLQVVSKELLINQLK